MKILIISLIFVLLGLGFLYAQGSISKQISSIKIKSETSDFHKRLWIYTPKSYKSSSKSYPVIYMFDAQNLFDAKKAFAGEWEIDEYLDSLGIPEKEVIVVAIEHGNEKRLEELTPFAHEKHGGGKGDEFLKFLVEEVKPKIDDSYRTLSGSEHTAIFGSSLGGLMSFYACLKYKDTFSKAGVFSPAFWINPEIYDLVKNTEIPKSTKFYFMAGDSESEEMVIDMEKMITLLKRKGMDDNQVFSKVVKNGEHNEKLWRENFPQAFEWLIK